MQHVRALSAGHLRGNLSYTPSAISEDYYLLELVGYGGAGGLHAQPRSPHYSKAVCLTAGGPDRKGGVALGWDRCQDLGVVEKITSQDELEAQAFRLNPDGSLYNKKTKLCLRRMACTEGGILQGYIYDLGRCDPVTDIKLSVQKAQANNVEHMRDMGALSHAVALELCELCGPYKLENMCMGGNKACGGSYQGKPGWTKLASQYLGYDATHGNSEYRGGTEAGGENTKYENWGIDMAGLGKTKHENGLCGSYVTDAPSQGSYWYVLKTDLGKK